MLGYSFEGGMGHLSMWIKVHYKMKIQTPF